MKLNSIILLALCFGLSSVTAWAQKDRQARKVLDQTVTTLRQGGGIATTFTGSSEGSLRLKGDCFYLKSNGIQSWFDGKTQWSYLEDSEEVNITHPSPEELQTMHPVALLSLYRQGYNYRYNGTRHYDGQTVHVVTLTPDGAKPDGPAVKQLTVYISPKYLPLYIKVETPNGSTQEFRVTSCQLHQSFDASAFTFDRSRFPDVEIIDLR